MLKCNVLRLFISTNDASSIQPYESMIGSCLLLSRCGGSEPRGHCISAKYLTAPYILLLKTSLVLIIPAFQSGKGGAGVAGL